MHESCTGQWEYLRFVLKAPEAGGKDQAIEIPLKARAGARSSFIRAYSLFSEQMVESHGVKIRKRVGKGGNRKSGISNRESVSGNQNLKTGTVRSFRLVVTT